jgi:hypothetical protein
MEKQREFYLALMDAGFFAKSCSDKLYRRVIKLS